jgi:hypothetical protein
MKRIGLLVATLFAGASVVACGGGGGMVAEPGLALSATTEMPTILGGTRHPRCTHTAGPFR